MASTSVTCSNIKCPVFAVCRIRDYAQNCSVHSEYLANKTVCLRIDPASVAMLATQQARRERVERLFAQ